MKKNVLTVLSVLIAILSVFVCTIMFRILQAFFMRGYGRNRHLVYLDYLGQNREREKQWIDLCAGYSCFVFSTAHYIQRSNPEFPFQPFLPNRSRRATAYGIINFVCLKGDTQYAPSNCP